MLTVKSEAIVLTIGENAKEIIINDVAQGQRWVLDPKSLNGLNPAGAKMLSENQIEVMYNSESGSAVYIYAVCNDYVEVTLSEQKSGNFAEIVLPGSFEPEDSSKKYLFPMAQGVYWDTRGEPCERRYGESRHTMFGMPMYGCLGKNGALLYIAETFDDCVWSIGKDENKRTWAANIQTPSLGTMRYDRVARLYFPKSTITAVAKSYRARVIEKGRFKSWKEKIAERPALERLFGAIMCFIGYSHGYDIDYVNESKKLKAAGVDKGSGAPNTNKVAKVNMKQIEEIAKIKMADLNANDVSGAAKIIEGTARSMGITVEA